MVSVKSILYIMELRVSSKNDISDRPFLHVIVTKFAKLNVDTTRNKRNLFLGHRCHKVIQELSLPNSMLTPQETQEFVMPSEFTS